MVSVVPALAKALHEENVRLREALQEIHEIAAISEGAEFYAMLAEKALNRDQ